VVGLAAEKNISDFTSSVNSHYIISHGVSGHIIQITETLYHVPFDGTWCNVFCVIL